jgi:D-aminoacyl-tRNA deacylase
MRLLLQRVVRASVSVDATAVGSIGRGYLLFLGVMQGDTDEQAQWLASKIAKLRLFDGDNSKINDRSIVDIGGDTLVVSQFTLAGSVDKGNRPDYTAAQSPQQANALYERFQDFLRTEGIGHVEAGRFGAHMEVTLVNDGPVTLLLEK